MTKSTKVALSFIFLIVGVLAYSQVLAVTLQSNGKGIQISEQDIQSSNENLFYGVITQGSKGGGNLIKLQRRTGPSSFADVLTIGLTGNIVTQGTINAASIHGTGDVPVCLKDGTDCPAGGPNNLQTVTDQGANTNKAISVGGLVVNGQLVCLRNGAGCPTITHPSRTLQAVTEQGTTTNRSITLQGTNLYFTQTEYDHFWVDSKRGIQMRIDSDSNSSDTFTIFNGENSAVLTVDEAGNTTIVGTYIGSGSGLTSLNGSNITSGTVPSARLPLGGSIEFTEWGSTCEDTGQIPKWNGSAWACSADDTGGPGGPTYTAGSNIDSGQLSSNVIATVGHPSITGATITGTVLEVDNENFYLNGDGNVQIRLDADDNTTNDFRINNGDNETILRILEGGTTYFIKPDESTNDEAKLIITHNSDTTTWIHNQQKNTGGMPGDIIFHPTVRLLESWKVGPGVTGHVGIGDDSIPGSRLSVYGSATIGDQNYYSTAAPSNGMIVQGTVGIGTQLPNGSYKLDVSGDANASRLCIAGDCRAVWPSEGAGAQSLQGVTDIDAVTTKSIRTGNIGIGITDPTRGLHIVETSPTAPLPAIALQSFTGFSNIWEINVDRGDNDLHINKGGSDLFNLSSSGNVGIKKSPHGVHSVDVSGSINASSQCVGGVCKTTWGPDMSDTFNRVLGPPGDGNTYDCTKTDPSYLFHQGQSKTGYVMVGIVNTSPAKIICARMW